MTISEHNIQHFKFQSQHFHKCLSIASGEPEIKGTKALDRYSRMLGFNHFNHIHEYLARQTRVIKYFPFPTKHGLFQEFTEQGKEILEKTDSFYKHYFFAPAYQPENRKIFNASLRKMDSFTQFPIKPEISAWENGDSLAVELARYLDAPELMEKQVCGIFMVYYDFYQHDLIPGFNFQDVLDLLHPGKFLASLQLYKTELITEYGMFSTADHCHSKLMEFCSIQDLENHRTFYLEKFCQLSKPPLSMHTPRETLFDKAYSRLVQL